MQESLLVGSYVIQLIVAIMLLFRARGKYKNLARAWSIFFIMFFGVFLLFFWSASLGLISLHEGALAVLGVVVLFSILSLTLLLFLGIAAYLHHKKIPALYAWLGLYAVLGLLYLPFSSHFSRYDNNSILIGYIILNLLTIGLNYKKFRQN